MICKKMGRNVCLVVISLATVMIFYAISVIYIQSSVMGKSSADLLKERLQKKEVQKQKELQKASLAPRGTARAHTQ